jgi:hypothetical protein
MTTQTFRTALAFIVFALIMVSGPVLFAQASTAVGVPLEPSQLNEGVMSFVWAYAGSALLEWWKKNPKLIGFSEESTTWAKRRIAILTAVLAAIGVHSSFDAVTGTLTITGLLLPNIWTAIGDSIRQFVFQQYIYRSAIEKEAA